MPRFLELLECQALPIQLRHVGSPLGVYVSDIGLVNQVIQLWGFDDYAAMEARRDAWDKDPAWSAYTSERQSLVAAENVRMVRRVPGL